MILRVRDFHSLWCVFPVRFHFIHVFVYRSPTTPRMPKHAWFRLFPVRSPLLRESLLFSFPPGTEMFQFPGFAPVSLQVSRSLGMGCPIRISADQFVFANPRGLSQLITSFFASKSQGILRTPFFNFLSPFSINYELQIMNYEFFNSLIF